MVASSKVQEGKLGAPVSMKGVYVCRQNSGRGEGNPKLLSEGLEFKPMSPPKYYAIQKIMETANRKSLSHLFTLSEQISQRLFLVGIMANIHKMQ